LNYTLPNNNTKEPSPCALYTAIRAVTDDFLTNTLAETAKYFSATASKFIAGGGYVSTAVTIGSVLDKIEKNKIMGEYGGDRLVIYTKSDQYLETQLVGTRTTFVNELAVAIYSSKTGQVKGLITSAYVSVNTTGFFNDPGKPLNAVYNFDIQDELLRKFK